MWGQRPLFFPFGAFDCAGWHSHRRPCCQIGKGTGSAKNPKREHVPDGLKKKICGHGAVSHILKEGQFSETVNIVTGITSERMPTTGLLLDFTRRKHARGANATIECTQWFRCKDERTQYTGLNRQIQTRPKRKRVTGATITGAACDRPGFPRPNGR